MSTGALLALQFADWVLEQKHWAETNGIELELVLFPGDAEGELVSSVTECTTMESDKPVFWYETKDHRVSIRLHGVKIGFDDRIPSGGYMLRFGRVVQHGSE